MMRVYSYVLAAACLGLAGCGGEGDGATGGGGGTTGETTSSAPCAPAEVELPDGRCQPPGLPLDMECAPGETPLDDGSCQAAGVPPDECGKGFEPNGKGGCKPILPEEPCPDGLMAIPGETECHEVAPCGTGAWGDIPVDADTQFVDASYPGVDSDGTEAKPWKTIQEALDAAAAGGLIAVAAGTYQEDVKMAVAGARLWGRCPSMVTIQGVKPQGAAIAGYATGAEVHGVAITGPYVGVFVSGPDDFLFENVWIHDTGVPGAVVDGSSTAAVVRGSLFERTHETAVQAQSGTITIESTAIRDSLPNASQLRGRAVTCAAHGEATVRSSLLERATESTIWAIDSDVTVEDVAVRDTMPVPGVTMSFGYGIQTLGSNLTVRGSTIERVYSYGIIVDSDATIERTTVTDGMNRPENDLGGNGIILTSDGAVPANLVVQRSAISGHPDFGLGVLSASVLVESTLLQDNAQKLDGPTAGVILQEATGATIRHTVIAGSQSVGIQVSDSEAVFEESVVRDMRLDTGAGVCMQVGYPGHPPTRTFTVRSSSLEDCSGLGIGALESHLVVETSVVSEVLPTADGSFGDAIQAVNQSNQAGTTKITGVRIDKPYRAGVAAFGATVEIGFCAITCAPYDLVGEKSGSFDFSFVSTGDTLCGCPDATEPCVVESPGFQAPP